LYKTVNTTQMQATGWAWRKTHTYFFVHSRKDKGFEKCVAG